MATILVWRDMSCLLVLSDSCRFQAVDRNSVAVNAFLALILPRVLRARRWPAGSCLRGTRGRRRRRSRCSRPRRRCGTWQSRPACRRRRRSRRPRSGRWPRAIVLVPPANCGELEDADRAVPDDGAGVGDDFGRAWRRSSGRRRECGRRHATSSTEILLARGRRPRTSSATTTSVGSGTSAPRAFIMSMMAWASLTRSASASELPIVLPAASRKVLAMPPPTISWSTLSGQRLEDGQLGRHLGAADDGDQRALRAVQGFAQGVDFGAHQHAGTGDRGEFGDAVGGGFGAVGGAEGVIDVDVAELGHLLRQLVVVLLFALVARGSFRAARLRPA